MEKLLQEIRQCQVCLPHLEHGVRPVLTAAPSSKIIIIGQAPGRIVHQTGIPWDDKSGKNLREWLAMKKEVFYDANQVALLPMGFCYPGTGKSGDLPPRKECAPLWHQSVLNKIENPRLILLIGQYAQKYYLGKNRKKNLTETVRNFREYLPQQILPLPHPSPRNNIWLKRNQWFAQEVLPELKIIVTETINS